MSATTLLENRLRKRSKIIIPLLQVNSCFILVENYLGCIFPSIRSLAILQLGGREGGILLISLEVAKLGLARSLVFVSFSVSVQEWHSLDYLQSEGTGQDLTANF